MPRSVASFLFLTLLIIPAQASSPNRVSAPDRRTVRQCAADDDLAKAMIALSSGNDGAQAALLTLRRSANHSSECRKRIIAALIAAMDKPNLDISQDRASANLWRAGAPLLGDLKAIQALDLLLAHIKMTDGEWSISMVHQPALEGIIRIGNPAIPKLKSLLQNEDWETRHYAVYCLFWIGGPSARRALEKALPMETDRCVKPFISVSLKTLREANKTIRGANNQSEWVSSFMCGSWLNGR